MAKCVAFMRDIMDCEMALSVRLAVRFIVLTACRHGQARKAKWGEIDLERAIWNCPVSHMKMRESHRVPLSDTALDVLSEARKLHDGDLIFPSPRKRSRTGGCEFEKPH